jgi:enoyl-CoA hydratase
MRLKFDSVVDFPSRRSIPFSLSRSTRAAEDLSELTMAVDTARVTPSVTLERRPASADVTLDAVHGGSGEVAVVSFSAPPVNAFDTRLVAALEAVVDTLAADADVRAVIFRGAGKVFSAGADVTTLVELVESERGVDAGVDHVARMQEVFAQVAALPVPTIAAVHGAAAGGGLELALACDLRVAERTARLGLPEVGIGLVPGAGGTQRLSRLLGPGAAAELVLEAQLIEGARAAEIGLVQHLSLDGEAFDTALRVAGRIARAPRPALEAAKRCLATSGPVHPRGLAAELDAVRLLLDCPSTRDLLRAFTASRGG